MEAKRSRTGSVAVLRVPEVFEAWELCFIQSGWSLKEASPRNQRKTELKMELTDLRDSRRVSIVLIIISLFALFSFVFTSMSLKAIFLLYKRFFPFD